MMLCSTVITNQADVKTQRLSVSLSSYHELEPSVDDGDDGDDDDGEER